MSNENEANDLNTLTNKFVTTIFKSNHKTQECVKQQFQIIKALNERVAELEKKIIATQKMEENATNNCNEDKPQASDITLTPVGNQECNTTNIVAPTSDSYEEPIMEPPNTVEDESNPCTCNCLESSQPSEECDEHVTPIGNQEYNTTDILPPPSDSYEEPIVESPSTIEPCTCNCPESTHEEYDDHLTENKNERHSNNQTDIEECNEESKRARVQSTTESVETSHLQAEVIQEEKPWLINNQEKNVNNYVQEQDMSSAFGNFTAEFTKHLMMSIQPMIDENKMRENVTPNEISSTDVN